MKKTILLLSTLFLNFSIFAQNGLQGEYYNGQNFEKKILTRNDKNIDYYWNFEAPANGIDPLNFSVRWTGKLLAPESGKYLFSVIVDDGVRLWIDNKQLINAWDLHDKVRFSNEITLNKGQSYDIKIEYFNGTREGVIKLHWQKPSEKPLFGGFLGTNEKIISSEYFTSPSVAVAKNNQKPSEKPPVKPAPVVPKPTAIVDVPKPKPIAPPKDTLQKYIPKNIFFEQSTSKMYNDSQAELDYLATMLKNYPLAKLTIEGHTDNIGDAVLNQKLSDERAQAVKNYLTAQGIAGERLTAKGYGSTRPLFREVKDKANSKNRRVEFIVN
jgi:outer membrane protein OmpA-like peptidoglycan-associated protein